MISLTEFYLSNKNKQVQLIIESNTEIERLIAESTEWESKFYEEVKKNSKAIEYIEQHNLDRKPNTTTRLDAYTMQERKLLDILKGEDNE